MKLKASPAAGAALTCAMIGALTPTAALADSSAAFSVSTICPGDSVTLTVNGISDGSPVVLTDPEYFRLQFTGGQKSLASSMTSGTNNWSAWSWLSGKTYTIEVITGGNLSDPTQGTVLSTTSLEVLAECAAPALEPEPEAEALPNTGIDLPLAGITLGSALAIALAGFFIIRTSNLMTFASANQKVAARMKRLDAILGRMENGSRRARNNRR